MNNTMQTPRSLFIESRLWIDKTYGNTYYSARVWVNGKILFTKGISYGYDLQYLYDSLKELKDRGITNTATLYELRDTQGIDVYYSATYGKKSDLFKGDNN